jgi:hypothetical protein
MDPVTLQGNDGLVWLILIILLLIAAIRARTRRHDPMDGESSRAGLGTPFGEGPDRSSFRYRR